MENEEQQLNIEEEKENSQRLIIGAVKLMTDRLNGHLEPVISLSQFEDFKNQIVVILKAYLIGEKTYDELYTEVEQLINMPFKPDDEDLNKFIELVQENLKNKNN